MRVLFASYTFVGCTPGSAPNDLVVRVEIAAKPPVELRVRMRSEHARQAPRFESAARATLSAYADRFGVMPFTSLTVEDSGRTAREGATAHDDVVFARTRWLAPALAMEPEIAVTRAVGRQFWRKVLPCGVENTWFVDGLNQYTATPVIASLFAVQQTPPSFAFAEVRYFAGFVPLVIRVPMRNASAGNGLADFRENPAVDLRTAPASDRDRRSAVARTALAMGTLERWLGAPTWDAVLQDFAGRHWTTCPSAADLGQVALDVTGLDVSWFFSQVFASAARFDYGIEALSSVPLAGAASTYRTTVAVRRYGDAAFTGTSATRVGPYESGRGMLIRVAFEDGSERTDTWDGRDASKTFSYESASPARSAVVDPDGILLLDTNQTNNGRMLHPRVTEAATKWAARWSLWLQSQLLTFASLV